MQLSLQPTKRTPSNSPTGGGGNPSSMGSLITKIFTPGREKRELSRNATLKSSLYDQQNGSLPLINDKNLINHLPVPFSSTPVEHHQDDQHSWRSYNIGGYRGLIRHTLKVSKRSQKHLTNLLDLETENVAFRPSPDIELVTYIAEGNENVFGGADKFKVKWQAPQRPVITLKKTAPCFVSKKERRGNSVGSPKGKQKPNAVFLSTSRDKLENLRLKAKAGIPDMNRYDIAGLGVLKPRIKEIVIPKATLERDKPPRESSVSPCSSPFYTFRSQHKSVPDFSKQLSRGNEKKTVKVEPIKDLEQLEKDFQFSHYIKQKYDLHSVSKNYKKPQTVRDDPRKQPFTDTKLAEARRNIFCVCKSLSMAPRRTNTFHANDFLTRGERITRMEIPESTEKAVIVKPNNEGIGFKFNCYSKEYLPPSIDKATFDKTVKMCHKICENTYIQKKNEQATEYNGPYKKILYAGAFLVFISLILLVIRVYGSDNDGLLIAALVLISTTIVSTVLVVIKMYLASPEFINLEEVTKTKLSLALEQENRTIYRPKGFEWVMEPNYYWLELHNLNISNRKTRKIMTTEEEPLSLNNRKVD